MIVRNLTRHGRWWQSYAVVVFAGAIGTLGCSGGSGLKGLVPVSGKVTMDGKPLAGAQVTFVPDGTVGPPAATGTNAEGLYHLTTGGEKGALPGKYKVVVSQLTGPDGNLVTSFEEGMDIQQLEASGKVKQNIPPKYSDFQKSELSFEVKSSGPNTCDIPLTKQ